jgi:hypothetical protein
MARIFPSLETDTRGTVDTETAAHYLNYSTQTLRLWSSRGTGPIQPHRVEGAHKLHWRVADIRKLLGVAA